MKTPSHIIVLYHRTVRRYKKLKNRLKKYTTSPDCSTYKRNVVIEQLVKLRRKLQDLQLQLKVAVCAGAIALVLDTSSAKAQTTLGPFVERDRVNNPLRGPLEFEFPSPAAVDLDNDGNVEIVVNQPYSMSPPQNTVAYLKASEVADSVFVPVPDEDNPFLAISNIGQARFAFADIDEDGDQDLFTGIMESGADSVQYYRNDNGTFSQQTGPWNSVTKEGNPLHGLAIGYSIKPCFVDFDNDGDMDVFMGASVFPTYQPIHYYVNDGEGNFTDASASITLSPPPSPSEGFFSPALTDVDADGDFDLVVGTFNSGELRFYQQTAPLEFTEGVGSWDPIEKTGNPFDTLSSYSKSNLVGGLNPVFADLDRDGDQDFILGNGQIYGTVVSIPYLENLGEGVFAKRSDLDNPLGGVHVRRNASPVFIDIDGDNDLDALIGNKYNNYDDSRIIYYKNESQSFVRVDIAESPFSDLRVTGDFTPSFGDIDNDGDPDLISGNDIGEIIFFRNDSGTYTKETEINPFNGISVGFQATPQLVDINGDGTIDLFVGNHTGEIAFFQNTGTPEEPTFTLNDEDNPLAFVNVGTDDIFLHFNDMDHDGDYDVFVSTFFPEGDGSVIVYYENIGTATAPEFELAENQPFDNNILPTNDHSQTLMADYDLDGDLDIFVGNEYGQIQFFENQNPTVAVNLVSTTVNYDPAVAGEFIVDPELTLSDTDNDLVVQATVSIENFTPGEEELTFTPQNGITGNFDAATGVLMFTGKDTLADYQSLLRTVAYSIISPESGERTKNSGNRTKDYTVTISFRVYDSDNTNPIVTSRNINVVEAPPTEPPPTEPPPTEPPPTEPPPTEPPPTEPPPIGELVVYNAVAPNSSGDNKFMRILNLPEGNKVSIFNRWGDKVFETENYDHNMPGKRFEGLNNNGNVLPTGTYFYKIEFTDGSATRTGYLALIQ